MNSQNTHDFPPQEIELEQKLLAAILYTPSCLENVMDMLKPEHFFRDAHRVLYEVLVRMTLKREVIEYETVLSELRRTGKVDRMEDPHFVTSLFGLVAFADDVETYAQRIRQAYVWRALRDGGLKIFEAGQHCDAHALEMAEGLIYAISQDTLARPIVNHRDALSRYMDRMQTLIEQSRSGIITGVPTGYPLLDKLLGGLRPGKMITLAARPGQGKTALALNVAYNAVKRGNNVLIFSLEMEEEELMQRWVAMEAGLDSRKLRDARLTAQEEQEMYDAIERLASFRGTLWIDDTCGLSQIAMRSKARRMQTQHGLDLIILDYLQLAKDGETDRQRQDRRLEVEAVSRAMKELARELSVPVLSLAQMSRAVEQRANKIPQLSDLREAGGIEQDSDVVLFIHKDETIAKDAEEYAITVLIEKHRSGPVGMVPLRFIAAQTKYYPIIAMEGSK